MSQRKEFVKYQNVTTEYYKTSNTFTFPFLCLSPSFSVHDRFLICITTKVARLCISYRHWFENKWKNEEAENQRSNHWSIKYGIKPRKRTWSFKTCYPMLLHSEPFYIRTCLGYLEKIQPVLIRVLLLYFYENVSLNCVKF